MGTRKFWGEEPRDKGRYPTTNMWQAKQKEDKLEMTSNDTEYLLLSDIYDSQFILLSLTTLIKLILFFQLE